MYFDRHMDGRTLGTLSSDWVAAAPLPTVTGGGTVEAELQGGAATVTAGKYTESCNYITAQKSSYA